MATNIDQPGDKLKRTIAAAIAAVTAGTSMWLAASAAGAATAAGATAARPGSPTPSATLRVVPGWTYQDGGQLAAGRCTRHRLETAAPAGPDEQGQEPAHQAHRKDKTGEIHNRAALRGQAPGARLRRREIGQDLHGPRRFPAAGSALPAGPFHARCDHVRRAAARGRAPQEEEEGALAR